MALLEIIIVSTRPTRVGPSVSAWFEKIARDESDFDVHVTDLLELDLPFLDEPKHPRFGDYQHQHTRDWSDRVAAADAFVFVMPEYNYGFTAPLKNALDYLHHEWHHKPVGFVSYGGVAAGTRAVQMIKLVVTALKMVPLFEAVNIPFVAQKLDDARRLQANDVMEDAARAMLAELARVEQALRPLRAG